MTAAAAAAASADWRSRRRLNEAGWVMVQMAGRTRDWASGQRRFRYTDVVAPSASGYSGEGGRLNLSIAEVCRSRGAQPTIQRGHNCKTEPDRCRSTNV